MKKLKLLLGLILVMLQLESSAQVSAVFAGGNFYREREVSIKELKRSGFNTVIIWTIHVDRNGDLSFNAEFPIVQDGEYIGDELFPNFRADVASLKQAPTSITRVEFGLSAASSGTYENIRALYESEGLGPDSRLFRNFSALRDAIDGVDAFNNDDESEYDIPSSVAFTKMLASLGYQNTIAPFTVSNFWRELVSQVNEEFPGNMDGTYLQCYAGGANNNPCDAQWDFGIPVYPGLWAGSEGTGRLSPSQVQSQMQIWQSACGNQVDGGFLWLYRDFRNSPDVMRFANVLRSVFNVPVEATVQASAPSPDDNSTEVSVDANLTWIGGNYDATSSIFFGTSPNLSAQDFVTTSTDGFYDPGTLENNNTYYWRIDEENSSGIVPGETWSFVTEVTTQLPEPITNPMPSNGADELNGQVELSWGIGNGAVSYDVNFGTENPPPFVVNQEELQFTTDRLDGNTTYFWQVNSVNSAGVTAGEIQSFTTGNANIAFAATPTTSSDFGGSFTSNKINDGSFVPASGEWASLGESTPWAMLEWENDVLVTRIVLYDRPTLNESISAGTLEFSDGTTVSVGPLPDDGSPLVIDIDDVNTRSVRFNVTESFGPNIGLLEFEVFGVNERAGFPEFPRSFVPADQSTDIRSNIILRWLSRDADSYDVFLSENKDLTQENLIGNVTSASFEGLDLKLATTFYWKVDAINSKGRSEGVVNSFTTQVLTSSNDDLLNDDIVIYPNPSNGSITINIPNLSEIKNVELYSMSGKLMTEAKFTNSKDEIKLDFNQKGIFFLRVIQNEGNITQKIIFK